VTKVVILGARGFLGVPIAAEMEANGFQVVSFSRTRNTIASDCEIEVDLFDIASLRAGLLQSKPQVVISTAWDTQHGKFWTSSLNAAYKDATLKFAEISFELGVDVFLGLGTMSEYGANPGTCNAETTPLESTDAYSKAKIETGIELKRIGDAYNRKTNWLRVFQAFGPNEKSERFIPGLISTLSAGNPFSIRTPNYEMDWIHSSDIASAVLFSINKELGHFVDVGTGLATTVRGFSELVCSELDLDMDLLDYSGQVPGHQKKAVAAPSTELLSLGWTPTQSLMSRVRSLR
jgi:nucleoside-diphosphate-sugar epimerase